MEAILIWILSSFLTWLAGKLKISKTCLSIGLCILLGAGYYVATTYYDIQWKELVAFIWWVYASSQLVYNILKKAWVLEDKEGQK